MPITKTLVFTGTGDIAPDTVGFTVVTIDDPLFTPKTLVVEGMQSSENLELVSENYAGDGYNPVAFGGEKIRLNVNNNSVLLAQHGAYGLLGSVGGTITVYTRETT